MPTRWGLIPPWAKDTKTGLTTTNARAETATEKPIYRHPFHKRRRCLALVDGFSSSRARRAQAAPPLSAARRADHGRRRAVGAMAWADQRALAGAAVELHDRDHEREHDDGADPRPDARAAHHVGRMVQALGYLVSVHGCRNSHAPLTDQTINATPSLCVLLGAIAFDRARCSSGHSTGVPSERARGQTFTHSALTARATPQVPYLTRRTRKPLEAQMICHLRHGSPPRLMAPQLIGGPKSREPTRRLQPEAVSFYGTG